jgi:uncharacterized membrane protein
MQATTGSTSVQMAMAGNPAGSSHRELFRATMRKTQKTDWDQVIIKMDKQISRAGAVVLAVSVLYFTSIFVCRLLS